MKRPLLRVVCANHPSKTIGRVISGPDGPEWLLWRRLDKRGRQHRLERGVPVPQHLADRVPLAKVEAGDGYQISFADVSPGPEVRGQPHRGGYLMALCPRCSSFRWVHVSTVKEALAKPSPHRVLTV